MRNYITVIILATITALAFPRDNALSVELQQSPSGQLKAQDVKLPFELRGHRFVFHTYLPSKEGSGRDPIVLYLSGAGGWHGFDDHIATTMALHGFQVYGLSMRTYLTTCYDSQHPVTTEKLGEDCSLLIKEMRRLAGVGEAKQVLLGGWSLGAGYALIAAATPQVKPQVKGVVCISISRENESFYSLVEALKSRLSLPTRGPFLDAAQALKQIASTPVTILQAEGDPSASPKEAQRILAAANLQASDEVRLSIVKGARDHRFAGARPAFDAMLWQTLDWLSASSKQ